MRTRMRDPASGRSVSPMAADEWGVADGFFDAAGTWFGADPAVRVSIREAMGAPPDGSGTPPDAGTVRVLFPGDQHHALGESELRTADGATIMLAAGAMLPPELGLGYHELRALDDGHITRIVNSPGVCVLPDDLHTWGWAVQLYAVRSAQSWGIGDLADLRTLMTWSASEHGAGMALVNPLHAAAPTAHQQPSPYFPTSRCYRNPLYLRIEEVPGYAEVAHRLEPIAEAARALNADRRIDRDSVFKAKMAALGALWNGWRERSGLEHDAFEEYRRTEGTALRDFSTFCAITEREVGAWMTWPEELRRPNGAAVQRFREDHVDRVDFHAWLQWLIDGQLEHAGSGTALMADLAVGVDRGGADAWVWQDSFALDMSVGAPPDEFNTQGQDWGLPPFDPWKLRANGYEAFIRTVRSSFRHAGGVRIDHVMGLFRLYWVPQGSTPREGCYVYIPFRDLLGIVALESALSGAYVVGEDLGTIEDYVRHELGAARIMSYKLSQFETASASTFPRDALAAASTHDLATLAGFWTGSDLAAQEAIGVQPNVEGMKAVRRNFAERAGYLDVPDLGDAPRDGQVVPTVDELVAGVYRELATAPCRIVTATLEDAMGVEERPNMPGTVDQWPNWRIALPVPLEEILEDPRVAAVAEILRRGAPAVDASPTGL